MRLAIDLEDTIAAIASAPGGAFRGIVRLSGPHVVECLRDCFRPSDGSNIAQLRRPTVLSGVLNLHAPFREVPCDVSIWPTNRSYTRQPSAEIHTMGSPPLLDAVLTAVCSAGAQLAAPGEFTMRAFLAGRLDLTQAEAVLGVIDAASRAELDVALTQLAGGLAAPLNRLRDRLLDLLAHLEAGLDFVEDDIEFISPQELLDQLHGARDEVAGVAERFRQRDESATDFRVVLVGWPNVGKSSLLNALAGEAAAIVSPLRGTTRDFVARRIHWQGVNCQLIDTAGIDSQATDAIGTIAQTVTSEQAQQAHLQILCLDSTRELNDWEREQLAASAPVERLLVLTKTDIAAAADGPDAAIASSSKTGAGISEVRKAILERLAGLSQISGAVVAGTANRCRESLRLTAASLQQACEAAAAGWGEEFVAAELRNSLEELGKVVGAVYTDDVLDRIFSRFCIGK